MALLSPASGLWGELEQLEKKGVHTEETREQVERGNRV